MDSISAHNVTRMKINEMMRMILFEIRTSGCDALRFGSCADERQCLFNSHHCRHQHVFLSVASSSNDMHYDKNRDYLELTCVSFSDAEDDRSVTFFSSVLRCNYKHALKVISPLFVYLSHP